MDEEQVVFLDGAAGLGQRYDDRFAKWIEDAAEAAGK